MGGGCVTETKDNFKGERVVEVSAVMSSNALSGSCFPPVVLVENW